MGSDTGQYSPHGVQKQGKDLTLVLTGSRKRTRTNLGLMRSRYRAETNIIVMGHGVQIQDRDSRGSKDPHFLYFSLVPEARLTVL